MVTARAFRGLVASDVRGRVGLVGRTCTTRHGLARIEEEGRAWYRLWRRSMRTEQNPRLRTVGLQYGVSGTLRIAVSV